MMTKLYFPKKKKKKNMMFQFPGKLKREEILRRLGGGQ